MHVRKLEAATTLAPLILLSGRSLRAALCSWMRSAPLRALPALIITQEVINPTGFLSSLYDCKVASESLAILPRSVSAGAGRQLLL